MVLVRAVMCENKPLLAVEKDVFNVFLIHNQNYLQYRIIIV